MVAVNGYAARRQIDKQNKSVKAKGLQDFTYPTAEADRAIAYFVGDGLITAPNLVALGDYQADKIKDGDTVIGVRYFIGQVYALCYGPVDQLLEVWTSDSKLLWEHSHPQGGVSPASYGNSLCPAAAEWSVLAGSNLYEVRDSVFEGYEPTARWPYLSSGAENNNAWTLPRNPNLNPSTGFINEPNVWGAKGRGGGVFTEFEFHCGRHDQEPSPYATAHLETVEGASNAMRGVAALVFYGPRSGKYLTQPNTKSKENAKKKLGRWGESEVIKGVQVRVRRCPNQLGLTGNRHQIPYTSPDGKQYLSANPACVIYELMVHGPYHFSPSSVEGSSKIPGSKVDVESFRAVGNALYEEGFGITVEWNSGNGGAADLIAEIERTCEIKVVWDAEACLYTLVALRNDYYGQTLFNLDESVIISAQSAGWQSPGAVINRVTGSYTDVDSDYSPTPITVQGPGSVHSINTENFIDIDLTMLINPNAAKQRVTWEVNKLSMPLYSGQFECKFSAWKLKVGQVINHTLPEVGVYNMPCRVVSIDYHAFTEQRITVTLMQDIFSVSKHVYMVGDANGWQGIDNSLSPIQDAKVMELPAAMLQGRPSGTLAVVPERTHDALADTAGVHINLDSSGFSEHASNHPCQVTAVLSSDYPVTGYKDQTGALAVLGASADWVAPPVPYMDAITGEYVTPDPVSAIYAGLQNIFLIGDELIGLVGPAQSAGVTTFAEVYRGLFDTVPQPHYAGDKVWPVTLEQAMDSPVLRGRQLAVIRVQPKTYKTELPLEQCLTEYTYRTTTTTLRATRPMPIHSLTVNGQSSGTISGQAEISVLLREADAWYAGQQAQGYEGRTSRVRIYDPDNNLLRTVNLSSESYTYPEDDEILDSPAASGPTVVTPTFAVHARFNGVSGATTYTGDVGGTWALSGSGASLSGARAQAGSSTSLLLSGASSLAMAPAATNVEGEDWAVHMSVFLASAPAVGVEVTLATFGDPVSDGQGELTVARYSNGSTLWRLKGASPGQLSVVNGYSNSPNSAASLSAGNSRWVSVWVQCVDGRLYFHVDGIHPTNGYDNPEPQNVQASSIASIRPVLYGSLETDVYFADVMVVRGSSVFQGKRPPALGSWNDVGSMLVDNYSSYSVFTDYLPSRLMGVSGETYYQGELFNNWVGQDWEVGSSGALAPSLTLTMVSSSIQAADHRLTGLGSSQTYLYKKFSPLQFGDYALQGESGLSKTRPVKLFDVGEVNTALLSTQLTVATNLSSNSFIYAILTLRQRYVSPAPSNRISYFDVAVVSQGSSIGLVIYETDLDAEETTIQAQRVLGASIPSTSVATPFYGHPVEVQIADNGDGTSSFYLYLNRNLHASVVSVPMQAANSPSGSSVTASAVPLPWSGEVNGGDGQQVYGRSYSGLYSSRLIIGADEFTLASSAYAIVGSQIAALFSYVGLYVNRPNLNVGAATCWAPRNVWVPTARARRLNRSLRVVATEVSNGVESLYPIEVTVSR